ncbi:MAG: class I SAM-dependent methyltransferase, partial [Hyphomicrobiales bacterium]|nr:class I SAM-dependent methyltransferase [Hyphomicrobiales bacterium]
WLGAAAHAWTDTVVPQLGAWLAQDKASYIYLRDSIRRFLTPARLEAELRGAGLQRVSHRLMLGGRLALHQGWKVAA